MDLRHLRYFSIVASELNFTRAARRLNMAQPPLSQQIRELEAELGFALFDRSSRAIQLTQAGRDFLPEAQAVLDSVDQLKERAALRAQGELASLKIGVISSMASIRFAGLLRSFQKLHPGISLSLSDRPSAWQLKALQRGALDVGFLTPVGELNAQLQTHRLRREPMKLVVPSGHPLASLKRIDWKDLKTEALILVDPKVTPIGYYTPFFARCREAGFEPKVSQYTRNVATLLWMVSAGLGAAPMPVVPEQDRSASGVLFMPLPKNAPVYEIAMAWRRGDVSPSLKVFLDYAREYLKS